MRRGPSYRLRISIRPNGDLKIFVPRGQTDFIFIKAIIFTLIQGQCVEGSSEKYCPAFCNSSFPNLPLQSSKPESFLEDILGVLHINTVKQTLSFSLLMFSWPLEPEGTISAGTKQIYIQLIRLRLHLYEPYLICTTCSIKVHDFLSIPRPSQPSALLSCWGVHSFRTDPFCHPPLTPDQPWNSPGGRVPRLCSVPQTLEKLRKYCCLQEVGFL